MRITGGSLKNRSLKVPPAGVRPTSNKVRQALFNILSSHGYGLKRFLDCCAGSGSIGFEALSRGAEAAGFIENDKKTFDLLKNNAQDFKLEHFCNFFFCSATLLFLCPLAYDIAFVDPPYKNQQEYQAILNSLHSHQWLNPNALVIIETDADYTFDVSLPFQLWQQKKYGRTCLTFLKYYKQ